MASRPHDPETPERTRIGRRMQAAVYGTILVISVIAVASEYQGKPLRIMGSVLATQLVFYLAHVYAGQLGVRLETRHAPTRTELREILKEEWPLLAAAGPPALMLLVGGVTALNDALAVTLALGVGVGTLVLYGIRLGIAEERSPAGVAMTAAANGALGLLLVALKVVVH